MDPNSVWKRWRREFPLPSPPEGIEPKISSPMYAADSLLENDLLQSVCCGGSVLKTSLQIRAVVMKVKLDNCDWFSYV
jgi:hypothetical protein